MGRIVLRQPRRVKRHRKVLARVLRGDGDAGIRFDDLRAMLAWLGFRETARGSHHVFRRPGVLERINLQGDGGMAKVYQVRQVRAVLTRNGLAGDDTGESR